MPKNLPWFKFHSVDYQEDIGLRRCSLAARGLWVEMMCIIDRYSEPYGFMKDAAGPFDDQFIANKSMCPVADVRKLCKELEQCHVFSRDNDSIIYSRRMVRDGRSRIASTVASNGTSRHTSNDASDVTPDISSKDSSDDSPLVGSSHAGGRALNSDSCFVLSGNTTKPRENKKHRSTGLTDEQFVWFQEFWGLYWRKVSRKTAEQMFARYIKTRELFDLVVAAIRRQSPEMLMREQHLRPHAATWLNQARWEDPVEETTAPKPVVTMRREDRYIPKFEYKSL